MKKVNVPYYWMGNPEKIYDVARNCSSRSEFQKKYKGAYVASLKLKIHEEVCSHMIKKGRGSKRCIYFIEFPNKVGYVGLTNDFILRKKQHETYIDTTISNYKFISGHNFTMNMIEDYMEEEIAQLKEEFYLQKFQTDGYKLLNVSTTGGLGGCYIVHTINTCRKDASIYKTRYEYSKNNRNSYESARANNWLDIICEHMIEKKHNWNFTEILHIAKNYKSSWDFGKNNRAAYEWIRNNNLLESLKNKLEIKWQKNKLTLT